MNSTHKQSLPCILSIYIILYHIAGHCTVLPRLLMLGGRQCNIPCHKTRYDVIRVTPRYRHKSADRHVRVYGEKVSSDVFFTKVLLNPFMDMTSKDSNLLHAMITS